MLLAPLKLLVLLSLLVLLDRTLVGGGALLVEGREGALHSTIVGVEISCGRTPLVPSHL